MLGKAVLPIQIDDCSAAETEKLTRAKNRTRAIGRAGYLDVLTG
jgi:hypothetical protein